MCFHSLSMECKRLDAIKRLGVNWVLHPLYSRTKNPHHDLHHRTSETLRLYCLDMVESRKARRAPSLFNLRKP